MINSDEHLRHLRRRRIELALTQRQLAQLAHVSAKTISRLELGLAEPHPSTLARLAYALGCQPIDLLGSAKYDARPNL